MRVSYLQKIRYVLLLLLIVLIALSSHPSITRLSRNAGMLSGTLLSPYIMVLFATLFGLCVASVLKLKTQRILWLFFGLIVLFCGFLFLLFNTSLMVEDIRSIGICLCAITIGCHIQFRETLYRFTLLLYAVLISYIGLMQVLYGVGGFEILDIHISDNKNSIGVELTTAILIYVLLLVETKNKKFYKIVFLFLAIFTFILLLTIRARAASLATFIIVLYFIVIENKNNNKSDYLIRLFGIALLVFVVILLLPEEAKNYVYNSFFQNHEDDITSGRAERNKAALSFLKHNLLVGNIEGFSHIPWIHNFPLLKLYDYGLFFSFPILLLYTHLLMNTIKSSLHNKVTIWSFGFFALIIPFIISMAEPTFPFGPGTSTVFNFIMFGVSSRYVFEYKNEIDPNL